MKISREQSIARYELAEHIGKGCKIRRRSWGLTQRELAKQIGVTDSVIAQIERGVACPSCLTLVRMARILDISTDMLLGRNRDW